MISRLLLALALQASILTWSVAPLARAHEADIIRVEVTPVALPDAGADTPAGTAATERSELAAPSAGEAPGALLDERVTLTAATLALLAPVDADGDGILTAAEAEAGLAAIEAGVWADMPLSAGGRPCGLTSSEAALGGGMVTLRGRFACGEGALSQRFRLLSVLPAGYSVVLSEGGSAAPGQVASGNLQTLSLLFGSSSRASGGVPGGTAGGAAGGASAGASSAEVGIASPSSGALAFVGLGVEHILEGYDHLCFVLALLLTGGGLKRLIGLVTAFTAAHSLTLAATTLGWVTLPPAVARFVEIAIAASIVWVALENLVLEEEKRARHRPLIAFGFGLIHGFGFASVLRGYGFEESLAPALLGFNLGVELGQLVVLGVAWGGLQLLATTERKVRLTTQVGSVAIAAIGAFWLVARALDL